MLQGKTRNPRVRSAKLDFPRERMARLSLHSVSAVSQPQAFPKGSFLAPLDSFFILFAFHSDPFRLQIHFKKLFVFIISAQIPWLLEMLKKGPDSSTYTESVPRPKGQETFRARHWPPWPRTCCERCGRVPRRRAQNLFLIFLKGFIHRKSFKSLKKESFLIINLIGIDVHSRCL